MDIALVWDLDTIEADISFEDNDVVTDDGLRTATYISLFSDRQANDDDVLPDPGSIDKRGWWGDETSEKVDDKIGSRLWLLERASTVEEVLQSAKRYAEEALEWMTEEGVAEKINVTTARQGEIGSEVLAIKVEILRSSGGAVAMEFENLWEGMVDGA